MRAHPARWRRPRGAALRPGACSTRCADAAYELAFLTLHVGAGTFQPVRVSDIEEHRMHSEWYQTACRRRCMRSTPRASRGGRIVAVGTTTLRALESAASARNAACRRRRDRFFIRPGFRFRVVDRLITNFHLPRSTLLMLVCAFAGMRQHAARLSPRGGAALSILQLRRRDADRPVTRGALRATPRCGREHALRRAGARRAGTARAPDAGARRCRDARVHAGRDLRRGQGDESRRARRDRRADRAVQHLPSLAAARDSR